MRQEVIDKLYADYAELNYHRSDIFVKYHYQYNNVHVNVYFDAYDDDNCLFTLVLYRDREYYFTTLGLGANIESRYLKKIPSSILHQLLYEGHLDNFYNDMETHILNMNPIVNKYSKDIMYGAAVKRSSNEEDLPFLHTVRHVRMSDDILETLVTTMNIDRAILIQLQDLNYTLVRTGDISKRKSLTAILDDKGIRLVD